MAITCGMNSFSHLCTHCERKCKGNVEVQASLMHNLLRPKEMPSDVKGDGTN